NAAADKRRKELAEARNSADALVHSTEKALAEHGDKVGEAERTAIQSALDELKGVKDGDDLDAIRAKTSALAQASMELGEAMYQASHGQAASGAAESPAEDGVVDAEFEEVSG